MKKYGFLTTMSMIIGIMIGSGIFFKSDNILKATGGSVNKGILLFALAALSCIFGALAVAELASHAEGSGGIILYAEKFGSRWMARGFGGFQLFMYFPALIAVVSDIAGGYIDVLFDLNLNQSWHALIGLCIALIFMAVNILSNKLSGVLQVSATFIKLVPLIAIAVGGIFFGKAPTSSMRMTPTAFTGVSLLAAIAPITYSFDGWIGATAVSGQIKNSHRTLPICLVISPIIVLVLYISYFAGITKLMGVDQIIAYGNTHIYHVADALVGTLGAKIILSLIVVSVLGTLNGLIIAVSRLPYSLAIKSMLFDNKKLSETTKSGAAVNSSFLAMIIALIFILIHQIFKYFDVFHNSDISEISIIVQYGLYIMLYIMLFKLFKDGVIKSKIKGIAIPILAIIGAVFTLSAGVMNPMFYIGVGISGVIFAASFTIEYIIKKQSIAAKTES